MSVQAKIWSAFVPKPAMSGLKCRSFGLGQIYIYKCSFMMAKTYLKFWNFGSGWVQKSAQTHKISGRAHVDQVYIFSLPELES